MQTSSFDFLWSWNFEIAEPEWGSHNIDTTLSIHTKPTWRSLSIHTQVRLKLLSGFQYFYSSNFILSTFTWQTSDVYVLLQFVTGTFFIDLTIYRRAAETIDQWFDDLCFSLKNICCFSFYVWGTILKTKQQQHFKTSSTETRNKPDDIYQ